MSDPNRRFVDESLEFSWAMRFGQPDDDALGPFEHDTKARFVSDVFENFGNDLIF